MNVLTVYVMDGKFKNSLRDKRWAYTNNPCENTAKEFNQAFESYAEWQIYGNLTALQYIEDIINGGILTRFIALKYDGNQIRAAEELAGFCVAQNNANRRLLDGSADWYRIYCAQCDLTLIHRGAVVSELPVS